MNSKRLGDFGKVADEWTDERFLSRQDLKDLYAFVVLMVNLAESDDWQYDGHSLKIGTPMSMLTVRGTVDGIPHVVFTSGRTTMECIRTFVRKLGEGWLEWRVDRYRG